MDFTQLNSTWKEDEKKELHLINLSSQERVILKKIIQKVFLENDVQILIVYFFLQIAKKKDRYVFEVCMYIYILFEND